MLCYVMLSNIFSHTEKLTIFKKLTVSVHILFENLFVHRAKCKQASNFQ